MNAARPVRFNLVLSTVLAIVCLGAAIWFGAHAGYEYKHQEALFLQDKANAEALLERHQTQIDQTRAFVERQEADLRKLNEQLFRVEGDRAQADREAQAQGDTTSDARNTYNNTTRGFQQGLKDLRAEYHNLTIRDDGTIVEDSWLVKLCTGVWTLFGANAADCSEARRRAALLNSTFRQLDQLQKVSESAQVRLEQLRSKANLLTQQALNLRRDKDQEEALKLDAQRKLDALLQTTTAREENARQAALRIVDIWLFRHDLILAFCALAGALIAALRARQLDVERRSFNLPAIPTPGAPQADAPQPTLTLDNNNLTVTLQPGERLYAVPGLLSSDHASQRLIPPFLLGAPVARALTGRLRLALITPDDAPATFVGPSATGAFQTLHLASNQRVLINASALAAIILPPEAEQRGFRLVTRWRSLTYAAYWFTGRLLPTEVVGPAAVVLYAERLGPPVTPTALPAQLVAWSPAADLHLIPRRPTTTFEQLRTAVIFDNVVTLPADAPHTLLSHVNTQSALHQPLAFLLRHLLLGVLIVAVMVWAIGRWGG